MANESKKECSICEKIGLKPFTKENIFNYYIPLHGVVSYSALGVNVMNPSMVSKISPKKDMTNILLLSTLCGTAVYFYQRPHLKSLPPSQKALYATIGATLFSMGSVLLWAILKSALPEGNSALATMVGITSGAVIIKVSTDYLAEVDKKAKN